jgi:hypothetical protein
MFLLDRSKYTKSRTECQKVSKFARGGARLATIRRQSPANFMPDLPKMALAHELL